MASFHTKVSLRGFHFEDSILTVTLASGITAADIGKALTQDLSAPSKFKLAGDGDEIFARLDVVEDRKVEAQLVGAAAFRFANLLPIKAGSGVAVGDTVVGAGNGEVKPGAEKNHRINFVAEIIGTNAVVVKI